MLETVKEYKEHKSGQGAYAYIQFDSMNGKTKFQRAFKIGAVRRCALRCEGRNDVLQHKYLGEPHGRCSCGVGKWPQILDSPDPTLI